MGWKNLIKWPLISAIIYIFIFPLIATLFLQGISNYFNLLFEFASKSEFWIILIPVLLIGAFIGGAIDKIKNKTLSPKMKGVLFGSILGLISFIPMMVIYFIGLGFCGYDIISPPWYCNFFGIIIILFLLLIVHIIIGLLIGVLIGWIIGKIKFRKQGIIQK